MIKPVILSLKFKAPFESVYETEDPTYYDDGYYSDYLRKHLKDAEVVAMIDYEGVPVNPSEPEPNTSLDTENYYVDLLVYNYKNLTKEELFREQLHYMYETSSNMDVQCEYICRVANCHFIMLGLDSFYDQQFHDDLLRFIPVFSFETAIEPNLINENLEVMRSKVIKLMESGKAKYVYLYEVDKDEPFNEMWDTKEFVTYIAFYFKERHHLNLLSQIEVYEKCLEKIKNDDVELFGTYLNGDTIQICFI
ncbi:hypothetical protein [Flavobacterium sp. UBA6135]|uniref:hypothetical protein n=1 Tax=Flavobacterium sp. UBA6135 TaxID=1946553 RepID=UPI0025C5D49C|nr:hypothetical protein [Flavobacterium sp. UBA6135]